MSLPHHSLNYVEFTVSDLARAKTFFAEAFDWKFVDYGPTYSAILAVAEDDAPADIDPVEVGGIFESPDAPAEGIQRGPFVVLFSRDLEESEQRIVSAGGRITTPIFDFPGGRRLHFADPDGNELGVWAHTV